MTPSPEQKQPSLKNLIIILLVSAVFWLATELWMKPKMPTIPQNIPKISTGEHIWPHSPSNNVVAFNNECCDGALDLQGAVFYQWNLKKYTLEEPLQESNQDFSKEKSQDEAKQKKSKIPVALLSPKNQCFSLTWYSDDRQMDLPSSTSLWTNSGENLSKKNTPLVITWENKDGLIFSYHISLDEKYMLCIEQKVKNPTKKTYTIGVTGGFTRAEGSSESMVHGYEGPLGVFQGKYKEIGYKALSKDIHNISLGLSGTEKNPQYSWMGFSEKYWLSALIPSEGCHKNSKAEDLSSKTLSSQGSESSMSLGGMGSFSKELAKTSPHKTLFFGKYQSPLQTLKPGDEHCVKNRVFLGPKVLSLLESYETQYAIDHFDLAVDFGWFYFLTKPFLKLLSFLKNLFGNFGLAILVMTILVKVAFFPLSLKSHKSMMQMKEVQPKIEALRQIYGGDKLRLNQEIMALYKKEKLSPTSGCLPMILQMPVFFALYKVFSISIEMRQAPFWGWVQDMSLPDPTSIFNLFGLFSFSPPFGLSLGAWPILMGLTMFIQQKKQTSVTMDQHQRIMLLYVMPLMFMGFMAQLPVGLVIYSTWNNILTMAQQSLMTRFFPYDPKAMKKAKRLDVQKKTPGKKIQDFFSKGK